MTQKNIDHSLITTPEALSKHHQDASLSLEKLPQLHALFPIRLPQALLKELPKNKNKNLILQQFIPNSKELINTHGYSTDPLQEQKAKQLPGLLQKYQGRVLITLTQACAVHCRYCFRRYFPYTQNNPGKAGLKKIIAHLQQDTSIHEIILSGGDPLMVNNDYLAWCLTQFQDIKHLNTIRFHTRIPTVFPQRINSELIKLLHESPFNIAMVLHINHADEITPAAAKAISALAQSKLTLLNQSVLLKGINDNASTLINLSQTLWQHHILPYYLHLLDPVQGTAHFAVSCAQAKTLIAILRASLPGYLVPRLASEQAHAAAKNILA